MERVFIYFLVKFLSLSLTLDNVYDNWVSIIDNILILDFIS